MSLLLCGNLPNGFHSQNHTNIMSKQRTHLSVKSNTFSPMLVVLLVALIQVALIGTYFYLAQQELLAIEPAELALLLAYSALAIGLAIAVGIFRLRWMRREETVRQRLLAVIEAVPDPSAVRDLKGRYVMWNKAAETYYGIKPDYVLGKTPFELFPKDVARSILELDAQCSMSGQMVVKRLELPPLYGHGHRVVMVRVAPVLSSGDQSARGVVTILHDVTASEAEAAALRQTSTQLKMALDTSGFGSWLWDLNTSEQIYSSQYYALLRYSGKNFKEDFVFLSRLHPDDHKSVTEAAKRSIREKIPFDQIYRLRCFDDEYRYFHASGESVTDEDGKRQFAGLLCPLDDRNAK
jgi:PAS domain S-box-containing protein